MRVLMVLTLFAAVLALDARLVLKGAARSLKAIYFSMIIPSFVLLLLYSLDVPLPAVGTAITSALEKIVSLMQ